MANAYKKLNINTLHTKNQHKIKTQIIDFQYVKNVKIRNSTHGMQPEYSKSGRDLKLPQV